MRMFAAVLVAALLAACAGPTRPNDPPAGIVALEASGAAQALAKPAGPYCVISGWGTEKLAVYGPWQTWADASLWADTNALAPWAVASYRHGGSIPR